MVTQDTPRKTKLYRQIAKDYSPKQAEMNICRYIEALEAQIEQQGNQVKELFSLIDSLDAAKYKDKSKGKMQEPKEQK